MLKIYDKEVFVIELEEFRENAEQMLKTSRRIRTTSGWCSC